MRSKLVLVFNDDSEVNGVPKVLIFNNVLDAERYFHDIGDVYSIVINTEYEHFSFYKPLGTKVSGKAYWASEPF